MANVTVRDPFRDMRSVFGRSVMRRAFDEPFFTPRPAGFVTHYGHVGSGHVGSRRVGSGLLQMDVFESEGQLTVEAPLPGFDKDEVEVTLDKGKLTIAASHSVQSEDESTSESEGSERKYFIRERRQGSVSRSLQIGEGWEPESVEGALSNGVLTLTVKRSVSELPRKVEIN